MTEQSAYKRRIIKPVQGSVTKVNNGYSFVQ